MLNVTWIYDRWRQGKVVSGLFLDISGAFPNTVIPVLVHNMRKRGVQVEITDWKIRLNEGHTTVLTFDGYHSEVLQVLSRMDQGNPLSMTLFNFYGPDLLNMSLDPDKLKTAFVDDTMFLAAGNDFEEMNGKLRSMMERAGGANDWAVSHNAAFKVDKFALVHFSRKLERDPTWPRKKRPISRPALTLGNVTIQPSHSTKFLGVCMDQELRWHTQVNVAVAKGMDYMLAAKRLSKRKRGVPGRLHRGGSAQNAIHGGGMVSTNTGTETREEVHARVGRLREQDGASTEDGSNLRNWGHEIHANSGARCTC